MGESFQADFFKNNRAQLLGRFSGTAPIVISANGLAQSAGDNHYPFVQDSSFWYLTGLDEPDLTLILDKGREYLLVPERSAERVIFDGDLNPAALQAASGVRQILPATDGWRRLGRRLKKVKHVASLPPAPLYSAASGLYANPARRRLLRQIRQINPNVKLIDLSPHLISLRLIKQPLEIAAISRSIKATAKVLANLSRRDLSRYKYEYQIEALITYEFGRRGLKHAFAPIVAGGLNATQLHYTANKSQLNPSDILLVDIGASAGHYGADLSRCFRLAGRPGKRQQTVHGAVLAIHEYALSLLKPGVKLPDYEKQVRQFVGEKLRSLGLIKIIKDETIRRFYPHATSHFLGLNTHDPGDYQSPLAPNMVLTVEPGIYIAKEGLGIRIEDDVLITAKGAKVLSAKLKRDL